MPIAVLIGDYPPFKAEDRHEAFAIHTPWGYKIANAGGFAGWEYQEGFHRLSLWPTPATTSNSWENQLAARNLIASGLLDGKALVLMGSRTQMAFSFLNYHLVHMRAPGFTLSHEGAEIYVLPHPREPRWTVETAPGKGEVRRLLRRAVGQLDPASPKDHWSWIGPLTWKEVIAI